MPRILAALLVLLAAPLSAQEVKLPQTVAVAVGRLAAIEMSHDGDDFRYDVPPELDAFREYSTDPNVVRLRVIGYVSGTYRITAVCTKATDGKAKLSPFVSCLVFVGPSPGPGPGPVIPDPPKPDPPKPDPIPAGPRQVLILRESSEDTPTLARLFTSIQAGKLNAYLRSKGHSAFVLDDDDESQKVKDWNKALGIKLPALAILDDKGAILYRTTLPDNASDEDVMTVVKAWEGAK